LDILKLAIKIYEPIYAARKVPYRDFQPHVFYDERQKLGLGDAKIDEINEAFSWLERKGVIDGRGSTTRFVMTEAGKSTPPGRLIYDEQKVFHERLSSNDSQSNRKGLTSSILLACTLVLLIGGVWMYPKPGLNPSLIIYGFCVLCLVLSLRFETQAGKLALSNDDRLFVMMWDSYTSLKLHDSDKKTGYLRECADRLGDASRLLKRPSRNLRWDLVQDQVYGTFRKIGNYIDKTIIPTVKKGEIGEVTSDIVKIGTFFRERDISGLVKFAEKFDKKEEPSWRRFLSFLGDLSSSQLILMMTAVVWGGSYAICLATNRAIGDNMLVIFLAWCAMIVAVWGRSIGSVASRKESLHG